MYTGDDIVGMMLMANRGNKKKQKEILESPQLRGCGLKIARSYPEYLPQDLQDKPFEEGQEELAYRVLLEAIKVWNTRTG